MKEYEEMMAFHRAWNFEIFLLILKMTQVDSKDVNSQHMRICDDFKVLIYSF